jgi:hypothetical protein
MPILAWMQHSYAPDVTKSPPGSLSSEVGLVGIPESMIVGAFRDDGFIDRNVYILPPSAFPTVFKGEKGAHGSLE